MNSWHKLNLQIIEFVCIELQQHQMIAASLETEFQQFLVQNQVMHIILCKEIVYYLIEIFTQESNN